MTSIIIHNIQETKLGILKFSGSQNGNFNAPKSMVIILLLLLLKLKRRRMMIIRINNDHEHYEAMLMVI